MTDQHNQRQPHPGRKPNRSKAEQRHQKQARFGRPEQPDRIDIYGLHAVEAAIRNESREKLALKITLNAQRRLEESLGQPLEQIASNAMPIFELEQTDTRSLAKLLGEDAVHQGCMLTCKPLEASLDSLPHYPTRLLVLDQITDPHNVGAILRSASAFGVDAVITTARHSPNETGLLAKTASGALDLVPLIKVNNLGDTLAKLQKDGMTIIGLDSEGDVAFDAVEIPGPYALVLGAEGKGLRQRTRGLCTQLARLDMPGVIKSLNVSNAAALSLYAARLGEKQN